MKTTHIILALLSLVAFSFTQAATVTGRSADSSVTGSEKIPIDDAGTDKYLLVSDLWVAPVFTTGATASGSSAFDLSGSTGTFKSSTGLNTFGGSGHAFASILYPVSDDGAALGDTAHNFSDLFLATGSVINWQAGNVVLTHSSGILTLGTGELRITTAGTNAASVPTLGSTSTLTNKTLTSPVINGVTSTTGNIDFSGSAGTFKSATGVNTFGGSAHNFSAVVQPTTDDAAALGTTLLGFSDLFLATGGTVHFGDTNWVATHTSGILTVGTGDLRVTTAGTNTASVVTVGGTQTLTAKTLTSPVIGTGLTASGSAANTFAGSSGTFITSTGANTFKGSAHNFDAVLQPTTDDAAALGTTLLGFSDLFLATGGTVHFGDTNWVATHTSGILTVGTGDLRITTAGTNTASAVTVGGTQTLTNKTLTSPVIGTGLTASGSASNDFSASTGTFKTSSGTNTLSGAVAASSTFTQTSASATAFESGPNGGTNPVLRLVNNVSSAATGLSITGRAAAAGVDLTVLSSGTNESLVIEAKGSGTTLINGTATGAFLVADATNPAFSVVHTTEGTGVKVTSAAAASGVAVAAISSGANESMTIDAKGSGNVTLQGTATGNTIANRLLFTQLTEVVAATNVITAAESGSVFFLNHATEFVSTLPAVAAGLRYTFIVTAAPSGASYTVVTASSANVIKGMQVSIAGDAGDTGTADDTVTFVDGQAVAGDRLEVWCDGTNWFATLFTKVAAGGTFTQAD